MRRNALLAASLVAALALGVAACRSAATLPGGSSKAESSLEPDAPSAAPSASPLPSQAAEEGNELIGKPAPEWQVASWLGSEPLDLKGLRGRVVLVRWWTAPDCPFCSGTAPSLNAFHARYKDRGLVVVGLYHHKSDAPLRPSDVAAHRTRFGFEFPVAIDPEWQTLRAWWLNGRDRAFTSVSFLIDRRGVIRRVHPGGKYAPGDQAYDEMNKAILDLLAEPPPPGASDATSAALPR